MPARAAALVAAIAGGANVLVLFQIDSAGWPGYTSWCIGAGTTLCCGLIARERPRQAWAGLVLIIVVIGIWTLSTGHNPANIFALGSGQFSTLLIWYLTARISIDITARTTASETAGAEIAAQRRAHRESEALMRQAMTSVRRRVEPLLTAIADGAPITAGMRTRVSGQPEWDGDLDRGADRGGGGRLRRPDRQEGLQESHAEPGGHVRHDRRDVGTLRS